MAFSVSFAREHDGSRAIQMSFRSLAIRRYAVSARFQNTTKLIDALTVSFSGAVSRKKNVLIKRATHVVMFPERLLVYFGTFSRRKKNCCYKAIYAEKNNHEIRMVLDQNNILSFASVLSMKFHLNSSSGSQ